MAILGHGILSLIGGGLGLLLAIWSVDVLIGLEPDGIPRLENVRVNGAVILFTFGMAALTGIVFGLCSLARVRGTPPLSRLRR